MYAITYKPSVNQSDLYQYVQKVSFGMENRPDFFLAECTKDQVNILKNHDGVRDVEDWYRDGVPELVDFAFQKQIVYQREFQDISGFRNTHGNWGLARHSETTNTTAFNTQSAKTCSFPSNQGEGVDIILNIGTTLNKADTEFMTSGVTRLKDYDWNQAPGIGKDNSTFLSRLTTFDRWDNDLYNPRNSQVDEHAEGVAYACASNSYGWANRANLYVFPFTMVRIPNPITSSCWDAFKYFHENKGNNNPTIVVDAFGYTNKGFFSTRGSSIIFRDEIYNTIGPEGIPPRRVNRLGKVLFGGNSLMHPGSNGIGGAYGQYPSGMSYPFDLDAKDDDGNYKIDSSFGNNEITYRVNMRAGSGDQPSTAVKNRIMSYISNIENQRNYDTMGAKALKEMEEAGVHHVSSAGNYNCAHYLSDNLDYGNGILQAGAHYSDTGDDAHETYRTFIPLSGIPDPKVIGPNTISVAALSSEFSVFSDLNGKETLADFSDRGDRVDCCAAGQHIHFDFFSNKDIDYSGTSFASPMIAGMAACVLSKYPNTTPAQLRKYFRETAVGTDTLFDTNQQKAPSSNRGDWSYFNDPINLFGYSGKIAYLDPNLNTDPRAVGTNTTITSTETSTGPSNIVGHSIAEINTILDG